MLKKAGIVVAAAAAGLLALSPLAFAGDKGGEHHGDGGHHAAHSKQINKNGDDRERSSSGIVNVDALNGDNEVNVPIQACNNNVPIVNLVPVSDITGIVSLLDFGGDDTVTTDESCDQSNSSGGNVLQSND